MAHASGSTNLPSSAESNINSANFEETEVEQKKKGRKTNESIAKQVADTLKTQLNKIDKLDKLDNLEQKLDTLAPILHEVRTLHLELIELKKENIDLKRALNEQQNKITALEENAIKSKISEITRERSIRKDSLIIHGLDAKKSIAELEPEVKRICQINNDSEIKNMQKLGREDGEKRPIKVEFVNLNREKKTNILKSNSHLKLKSPPIRVDLDRSLEDMKMNKILLNKRYELRQENPAILYNIKLNTLIGSDKTVYRYNPLDNSMERQF